MNVPQEFSAFWSVTVQPKTISKVTVPENVQMSFTTGAVLPPDGTESGRVVLYAKVNGESEAAIFPFTVGKIESLSTDLFFTQGDIIEFYTKGSDAQVQVSGYLSGGFSLDVEEIKA